MKALEDMAEALALVQRRIAGMARHGTVAEVNAGEGWVRLDWGDGFLSAKLPYAQIGGALKLHSPPSEGQKMTAIAPTGDLRQAVAQPLGFSDANQSPGSTGGTHVLTIGGVTVSVDGSGIKLTGTLDITGAALTHNGKNVGSDHKHSGIVPGSGQTGDPL